METTTNHEAAIIDASRAVADTLGRLADEMHDSGHALAYRLAQVLADVAEYMHDIINEHERDMK